MSELRLVDDNHTVSLDCTLPGESECVWWHLTDPAGMRAWLAEAQLERRLGGSVRLRFQSAETLVRSNCGALVRGVISCYEPNRRLAYSWLDESLDNGPFSRAEAATSASRVTFNLTRGQGRTLLSLTHIGLRAGVVGRIGAGWQAHLALLANVLSEDADGQIATQQGSFVRRGSYVESSALGMRA